MLATLVIFLREGIEASMIVAILCAYLDRVGQRRYFVDVFAGVGAALVLATAGGVVAYYTIRSYDGSQVQTVFETITYLIAAVVLTYMTFWMHDHSRTISRELRERMDSALESRTRSGLFLLAFQAVGREGLETVVFTLAIIFSTALNSAILGAGIGLALSLALAFAIYRLGTRINIGLFFRVVGTILMVFAAGLLVDAVENLQELGWLPILTHPLWDSTRLLSEDSDFGDILHSFFGYVSQPTVLQVIVWTVYLGLVLSVFLGLWQRHGGATAGAARRRAIIWLGGFALVVLAAVLTGTLLLTRTGLLGQAITPPSKADQAEGMTAGLAFADPPAVTPAGQQLGSTWLRTLAYSNGPQGDTYQDTPLLSMNVAGQPVAAPPMLSGALAGAPADLANARIAQQRTVTLSESSDGSTMFINEKRFDMNQSVFSTPAVIGTVEEWTVRNTSGEIHPFHLHTGHFQVMSINGVAQPYSGEQDTNPVPNEQHGRPGQVMIRIAFADFPGAWMFHCHIAAHEDAGMMSFINVVPAPGVASN